MIKELLILSLLIVSPGLSSNNSGGEIFEFDIIFVSFLDGNYSDYSERKVIDAFAFLEENHFPYSNILFSSKVIDLPNSSYYGADHNIRDEKLHEIKLDLKITNLELTIIIHNTKDQASNNSVSSNIWSQYFENIVVVSQYDPVSIFAHEIMHYFGAVDLYYKNGLPYSLMSNAWDNVGLDSFTLQYLGWQQLNYVNLNTEYKPISLKNNGTGYRYKNYVFELRDVNETSYFLIYKLGVMPRPIYFYDILDLEDSKEIAIDDDFINYYNGKFIIYQGPVLRSTIDYSLFIVVIITILGNGVFYVRNKK